MVEVVRASQFGKHLQAIMMQGIAVGGFNVVDIHGLSQALRVPVLVIVRRPPDMAAVRRALFRDVPTERPRVPGAARKWKLIEQAGALEEVRPSRRALKRGALTRASGLGAGGPRLWIQRAGASLEEARRILVATTLHGNIPEAVRVAHLVAGGITTGRSRGRS